MALENPALDGRSFQRGIEEADAEPRGMTAAGTYVIIGLLFVIVMAAAAFGWSQVEIVTLGGREDALTPAWTWLAFLLTFIVAIVDAFAYRAAPLTSVWFALGEGSLLGFASRYYDLRFDGIVLQALIATLLAAVAARGGFLLSVRAHPVGHRDQRRDRYPRGIEPHARFRFRREGSDGGRAEVHAVVRRVRADALLNLDLRLGSAAAPAPSGQTIGERCADNEVLLKGSRDGPK